MKKTFSRILTSIVMGSLILCSANAAILHIFAATESTIVDVNPAVKDCPDGKENLFGSNPGLESDEWWKNSHNWTNADYSLVTDVKHGGNSSLKYSGAQNWDNGLYTPDITVKPNTNYTFSFWVRGDENGDVFGCMLDGNDKIGGSGENEIVLKPPVFDKQWHQVGYTFNTGTCTVIRFTVGPGGGTVYFDDFQLFEATTTTPETKDPYIVTTSPVSMDSAAENNIFGSNPGLESDEWWKNSHNWTNADYSLVTDVKHGGNSSLKYSGAQNWDNGLYTPDITVKPNTNYTFSFWVRGDENGDVFGCMLDGNDKIGGSGENEIVLKPPVFDKQWHQVGYTFNTGTCTVIRFTVGPGGGTVYFDDFQLFESAKANPPVEKEASIISLSPKKVDCAAADNLFGENAGAETDNWWKDGHNWNCGDYTRVNDSKHSGQYSIKYSGNENWDNGYFSPDFIVKPNTNYTFSVWVKGSAKGNAFVCLLTGNDKIGGEITLKPSVWNDTWQQVAYTINTGKYDRIRLNFGPGGGTVYYDDFQLFEEVKGIDPPEQEKNNPEGVRKVYHGYTCDLKNNLVSDSSCEEASYWSDNSENFENPMVVSSDKAYEGKNSLKFAANGDSSYIKWFDVDKDTNYFLSAMLSADPSVLGDIYYNIVDSSGKEIENIFTEQDAADYTKRGGVDDVMHVPSWDGNWYERINMFNTGHETKIGIKIAGSKGTLYFDNMKLFKEVDAIRTQEKTPSSITLEINPKKSICKDSDNLVANCSFENGNANWSNFAGFGKFVTIKKFVDNNVLLYDGIKSHAYYMSWFDIKPNTEYTLSYYVQVLEKGEAEIGVFDGSPKKTILGESHLLEETDGWQHYAVTFNSEELEKVAFYIYDGGGKAAVDKIRLFETSKGVIPSSSDAPVKILVDNNTDSPQTGVASIGSAMALLATAAGFVYKFKKKKNNLGLANN